MTYNTAYVLFTPSHSEQRSPPPYYRGCWHGVSRGCLYRYRHYVCSYSYAFSSLSKELYDPKAFVIHAASLRHSPEHCAKFPTAASRRSLGRVSVPVWPATLSGRLPIVALVGPHRRLGRPLPHQLANGTRVHLLAPGYPGFFYITMRLHNSSGISSPFGKLFQSKRQVTHVLLTRAPVYSLPKELSP